MTRCSVPSCGATDGVELHHLYSKREGCPDKLVVPLCPACHGETHGFRTRLNVRDLIKRGVDRARAEGRRGPRAPRHDLTDRKFGRLEVLAFADFNGQNNAARWWVRCDCDLTKAKILPASSLQGGTISCGCARLGRRDTPGRPVRGPDGREYPSLLAATDVIGRSYHYLYNKLETPGSGWTFTRAKEKNHLKTPEKWLRSVPKPWLSTTIPIGRRRELAAKALDRLEVVDRKLLADGRELDTAGRAPRTVLRLLKREIEKDLAPV